MFSEAEYALYVAQQEVRDLIMQVIVHVNEQAGEDVIQYTPLTGLDRYLNLNPLYYQTEQGLFLEYFDGKPQAIWSPMGSWSLGFMWTAESDAITAFEIALKEHLILKLFQERQITESDDFGPVFTINWIDGHVIPRPRYPNSKVGPKSEEIPAKMTMSDFGLVTEKWRRMSKRYLEELGSQLVNDI